MRTLNAMIFLTIVLQAATLSSLLMFHKIAIDQRAATNAKIDSLGSTKLERGDYDIRHQAVIDKVDELITRIEKVRDLQIRQNQGNDSPTSQPLPATRPN
jgi:hypothetical protein